MFIVVDKFVLVVFFHTYVAICMICVVVYSSEEKEGKIGTAGAKLWLPLVFLPE